MTAKYSMHWVFLLLFFIVITSGLPHWRIVNSTEAELCWWRPLDGSFCVIATRKPTGR